MVNKELLPDFIVIGAGKSGTTSLDNYLSQHPGIFMSRMKEPDFFAYETIDPSTLTGRDINHYQRAIKTIEEYQRLFVDALPDQKKGETSNTCLSAPEAAARMKHYVPDAKLIAILRQPTERLFSRYMHLNRVNRLPSPDFTDVLERGSIWWTRKDLIPEGYYARNLSRFYDLFPSAHIKVLLSEDLKNGPEGTMKELFTYIGVDPDADIDFNVEHNRSGIIRNKFYDKTIGSNSVIKKALRNWLPEKLYYQLTHSSKIKRITQTLNNANLEKAALDPGLHERITTEIYGEDIRELSRLIGRDLEHWLKPKQTVQR